MVDFRDLATVKQVAVEAPFITEAKLRWWIFHAETNGLKPALIKIASVRKQLESLQIFLLLPFCLYLALVDRRLTIMSLLGVVEK